MRVPRLARVRTIGLSLMMLALGSVRLIAGESEPLADGLYAEFETPRGIFVCELFYQQAPLTVANFTGLAEGKLGPEPRKPFYDGLKFHRVVPGFVVQGGDPDGTGEGGPGYEFADEFAPRLRHDAIGILSMANAGPDTNGSQFFVTLNPVNRLNYLHSVFGRTVRGLDVLSEIKQDDVITAVRIHRIGADAAAFKNDAETFASLRAAAKPYAGKSEPGPDAHFADPNGLLPGDVPRAVYFNYQLANFERATGMKIFIRLAANYEPLTPAQRPGTYTGALAKQLGFTDSGIVAAWFNDIGQWGLWIGERELPALMGRDGTVKEFMQESALHHAKHALLANAAALEAPLQQAAVAVYNRPLTEAEKLKSRVDALIAVLFDTFEPRP